MAFFCTQYHVFDSSTLMPIKIVNSHWHTYMYTYIYEIYIYICRERERDYFLEPFFGYTAKLRERDFSYTLCLLICIVFPIIDIFHQSGVIFTIGEHTLTNRNHPRSIVCIRVPSWCCKFFGFGEMYNGLYSYLYNV